MKTLDDVIANYKSETIDGRDLSRLAKYLPEDKLSTLGISLKPEYVGKHIQIEFSRDNILKDLESDVAFGFEKALNQRGLSAGMMFEVVSMWNWILEEGLEDFSDGNYSMYGLPLFKATALKYDFPNPIGEDSGTEHKYSGGY